jgi:fatty-acyl-CoA synthase
MFIAELDHPRFAEFDCPQPAHRHHGRLALPDRGDEAGAGADAHAEVTIAYGMTETSPVSCQSATDDPLDKRVSTVGQVQPHLEVKIVDPAGRAARPVTGELCTRGYSVMHGYWGDPPRPPRRSTPTAGCTPATWPPWTPRATSTSSAASRTW